MNPTRTFGLVVLVGVVALILFLAWQQQQIDANTLILHVGE